MTDLGEMKVKVGADISGLLSKVDAAKAKLGQLTEENGLLKAELRDLNQSLRNNDSAIAKLNNQIAKSVVVTKEDRAAVAALRKERDLLAASGNKISAAIKSTTSDLAINTTQLKAQASAVKAAESAGSGFAKGATQVYSGLRKLAYIIPGVGIAGLVTLISGPVIDAFSEWLDTLNEVSDSLKTMKANQENLNDILSSSNKEAAKQITDLKILYDAATNVNLSMKDRLAAVKGLQNEFPDYFKNIKQETILNGEAKTSYDAAADSILRMARAKAAINKLQDIGAKQLDNDIQKQKILNATTNEAARAQDRVLKQQTSGSSLTGGGAGGSEVTITREEQLKVIAARRDAALKLVEINAKSLKDQEEFIKKFIGLSDLAHGVETEIKTPKVKKDTQSIKNVETISDVLEKLAIQINFLNQKQLLLRTDESQAKINAIESTIDHLMQKFKLLSDNPVIIKLQAQAADIALQQIFKKDAADRKNLKIELPVEPEIKFADTFNEQVLRDQLLEELTRLGIKKTIPVKIGVDILGKPIFANSEKITKFTGTEKLQATFDDAFGRILAAEDKFASDFKNTMSSTLNDTLFSIGQSIGDAIGGGQDLGQAIFGSFFQILADGIEQLGKALIALGTAKIAVEKFALTPGIGTVVAGIATIALAEALKASLPKFATGGLIRGAGSGTSDSIPAWLSNGEFVMRSDIVSKLGVGFFDKLNRGIFPKFDSFGVQKFATGGFVSPNIVRASFPVAGNSIRGGQTIYVTGEFKLRNDKLVAAVNRGNAQISRNG